MQLHRREQRKRSVEVEEESGGKGGENEDGLEGVPAPRTSVGMQEAA